MCQKKTQNIPVSQYAVRSQYLSVAVKFDFKILCLHFLRLHCCDGINLDFFFWESLLKNLTPSHPNITHGEHE